MNDTIVAQATPPGKSGVAILRISGEHAGDALHQLGISQPLTPRVAYYKPLINPDTLTLIDNALVLYFNGPKSFTGEDIVELHCHGSKAVLNECLHVLLSHPNIRYAHAGEFTRRALEHGKMDLVQVESLADLIESDTHSQKELALRNLNGELSSHYSILYRQLVETRAFCEVYIDFPDDDLPTSLDDQINTRIIDTRDTIDALLVSASYGQKIRDGIKVAIIGAPNAGKSTLINALAKRDVAITSNIKGTTRDVIEAAIDLDGVPYLFYDTAGLHASNDSIEQEGMARAKRCAADADVTILLLDATLPFDEQLDNLSHIVSRETIMVVNKTDIAATDNNVSRETIEISATLGTNLDTLLTALSQQYIAPQETAIVTRARHIDHLTNAKCHLLHATQEEDIVLKAQYLINACDEIGAILGVINFEDVLDTLFSSFCIGK